MSNVNVNINMVIVSGRQDDLGSGSFYSSSSIHVNSGDAIINASHRYTIWELEVDRKLRKGMILFMAKMIHFQQVKPEMCDC